MGGDGAAMATDPCFTSATDLAATIRTGERSAVDVVDAYLDRIAARNDRTNAYVTHLEEAAREQAREADAAAERGEDLAPLHGVPIAVKDLAPMAGVRTTYGSVPLGEHVPETTAPAVQRLQDAGAIVLGKTNTSEFGHVAVTTNDLFGATGNPADTERTAGGSSGGTAAAVADGLAAIGHGTDAGGSVRIPASACGCYGLKPTFGRVPRTPRPDGLVDADPFTCTGPITRTVADAALALDVMAGPHPRDPFSLPADGSYREALDRDVSDLSVAYSPDFGAFTVDSRIRETVEDALEGFRAAGMTVEAIDGPLADVWDGAVAAGIDIFRARVAGTVANSEAAFGVDLGAHRDDLTPTFRAMVEAGEDVTAPELAEAAAARTAVYDALQDVFAAHDLLVTPTLGTIPFDKTEMGPEEIDGQPVDPFVGWYLTQPYNMSGHPAASVPAGTVEGLPVGMQVAGRRHADGTVLAASAAFEAERPWQAD